LGAGARGADSNSELDAHIESATDEEIFDLLDSGFESAP
jgi:hypothetical protein